MPDLRTKLAMSCATLISVDVVVEVLEDVGIGD
jgi:hypothetical protein